MRIVIPGGSGQIGGILCRAFARDGNEVIVLSRAASGAASAAWRTIKWDAINPGPWCDAIDGCDVVINLAGRSVNCRYNAVNRKAIMDSRVQSTHAVGRAIAAAKRPPRVWLQSSTATIYAHRFDAPNDERTGILGGNEQDVPEKWRFSIDVANAWEAAANEIDTPAPHTRKVLMRSAVTLSPDQGGIFDVMLGLVRMGLGGRNGNGRQFVSWIHDADFVRAVRWLIDHDELEGPVNLASPNPLPNTEFMQVLRKTCGGIGSNLSPPATKWMLEIGAVLMKTETELILKSRRVVPTRLLETGFVFEFPEWKAAALDLCARWRAKRKSHAR